MEKYESALLESLSNSNKTSRVQNVLGIGTGAHMVPWQPKADVNSSDSKKVCSVISAYRLLDVVAMLGGVQPAPGVERQFFQVPNTSFRVSIIAILPSLPEILAGH
jgi:hypothetical protein